MNLHLIRSGLAWTLALAAAWPCAAQTGAARTLNPGEFDAIEISGAAVVRYEQGEAEQVVVEGDEAVQRSVSVDVRNGVLVIRPSGGWKFWNNQRVRIAITSRSLQRLNVSGAADFTAEGALQLKRLALDISGAGLARLDQVRADELRFTVSGSGDAQVAGSVEQLTVAISGRSDFRGENLMSRQARVAISGVGHVKVWALQDLAIAVSGIGTVDYWGSPTVRRSSAGLSTINHRGAKPAPP